MAPLFLLPIKVHNRTSRLHSLFAAHFGRRACMVATPFAVRRPSVLLHLGALIAVGDGEAQVDFVLAAAADSVRREVHMAGA
ncbi:PPR repeat [Musa troglodytarum]|uniref:PPR repeat n=1 Tax=Musa troglodytarum TaxID=320322 RepID=A0A9E7HJG5_9LILI|nr:PPR repeat [Musa troglodytarum]URE35728.1 PPR repeat [Musa troglodytarum]